MTPAELRAFIDAGDVEAVRAAIAEQPSLVDAILIGPEVGWAPTSPIDYVSLAPFHGFARHDRMGPIADALLAAGVSPDGDPAEPGGPLLNAASYGQLDVALALTGAGADLEVVGSAVPGGGTPLAHAVHFGNTDVAQALVDAGARIETSFDAAGIGDLARLRDLLIDGNTARALRAAAVNNQVAAIDVLLELGAPIDVLEGDATALHWAAWEGKVEAVEHLVERGADPQCADPIHGATPLSWCRRRHGEVGPGRGHDEVETFLEPLTP